MDFNCRDDIDCDWAGENMLTNCVFLPHKVLKNHPVINLASTIYHKFTELPSPNYE